MFAPWIDKKKLMNKFYFQQEGGLDVLMKAYGALISKEWGKFGINKELMSFWNVCALGLFVTMHRHFHFIARLSNWEVWRSAQQRCSEGNYREINTFLQLVPLYLILYVKSSMLSK